MPWWKCSFRNWSFFYSSQWKKKTSWCRIEQRSDEQSSDSVMDFCGDYATFASCQLVPCFHLV